MSSAPVRLAVIGHPVAHSRSPAIHARFAQACGDDVDYTRLLAPLDDFLGTARAFADAGARGCNVTVPFKHEAFAACARLTDRARLAEAVNTLHFRDGGEGWLGDNTDGAGLVRDLVHNAGVTLRGAQVLLLGAGGASAGSLGPLIDEGPARVVVANRTVARADALVARFAGLAAARGVALATAPLDAPGGPYDVVVNATAASLQGELPPLPAGTLRAGGCGLDMMYGAAARPFLRWVQAQGATGRDGLGMLVEQAAEAYALWFGHRPPTAQTLAAMRAEVDASLPPEDRA